MSLIVRGAQNLINLLFKLPLNMNWYHDMGSTNHLTNEISNLTLHAKKFVNETIKIVLAFLPIARNVVLIN
jgi:hypothetical protein